MFKVMLRCVVIINILLRIGPILNSTEVNHFTGGYSFFNRRAVVIFFVLLIVRPCFKENSRVMQMGSIQKLLSPWALRSYWIYLKANRTDSVSHGCFAQLGVKIINRLGGLLVRRIKMLGLPPNIFRHCNTI